MKWKEKLPSLALDALMIIFSVLFALFINDRYQKASVNKQKQEAQKQIKIELNRNAEIINDWIENHGKIQERLTQIVQGKNDSLKQLIRQSNKFSLGYLTDNQNLVQEVPVNTAWESAKSMNLISEFKYSIVEQLTEVYTLQEVVTERSIIKILDAYFDKSTHNMKEFDSNLLLFQMLFSELVGQEYSLKDAYKRSLKKLK